MSKSDAFENDLLKLIFNGTAIEGLADNGATGPLASLFVSLHTADPGEAGDQTTSETSYAGYARVAVARSAGGWTVTGNVARPTAHIEFPECSSGSATLTHFAVGTAETGAGKILYHGALDASPPVVAGIVPRIKNTSTITEN